MNTFNEKRRFNNDSDASRDGKSINNRSYKQTNRGENQRSYNHSEYNSNRKYADYNRNDKTSNNYNSDRQSWREESTPYNERKRFNNDKAPVLRKKTSNSSTSSADEKPKRTRQRISKSGKSKVVRFNQEEDFPIRNYNRQDNFNPRGKFKTNRPFESKQSFFDPDTPIRLNRFLANSGICSRREADDYIQAGVISVNGEIVTGLGSKVLPTDEVKFKDQIVSIERKIYLLLNKPRNFITTVEDTHERKTVMDIVKNACSERIYPVGRLDRNTTGVLLFTNDGDLATKLTHPKYEKKKIYHVKLSDDLTAEHYEMIINGITLGDTVIKADSLEFVKDDSLSEVGIEIHSGQNRVVRRIFESLGYRILRLDRVYFAGLTKKNLPRGKYRFLTGKEISILKMGAYE